MSSSGSERESVLIPTGYDPGCYPCVYSLGKRGVHTVVASENDDVPSFASRYCGETAVLPDPDDDLLAYRDALVGFAARPDVQTVIPIREQDIYLFAKYRERFERYVSLVAPDLATLRRVHDRKELFDAAAAAGVPAPETRLLSAVDDWSPRLLVKSRYNLLADEWVDAYAPEAASIADDIVHLEPGETPDLDAIRERMGHEPIVQEFVPKAGEYMFAAIYDRGEPLATFQHRQIRGNSYRGGGGVYRKSIYDPELEEVARALLAELEWHGLACIEYMQDAETGEYKLAEINPRMWQSLPATVRAGADFPHYYWLQATGRADEIDTGPDPGYDLGVGSHLLYGEVGHLRSIRGRDSPLVERPSLVGTAWDVLASCYDEPHFDYLNLDDPGPFLSGVRHVLPVGK